jgi:hypothetical protein
MMEKCSVSLENIVQSIIKLLDVKQKSLIENSFIYISKESKYKLRNTTHLISFEDTTT